MIIGPASKIYEIRDILLKIDTPLYPHIAVAHGGKCSALISVLDC
jgi:hypothetical protein